MKILIPQNIYSALLSFSLDDKLKEQFDIKPSSMIASDIVDGKVDAGFIPSMDILTNRDLAISSELGFSFDGTLSNTFLYFINDINYGIDELLFRGDLCSNDIILSKILFKEKYDVELKSSIDTKQLDLGISNYLISGNENIEAKGFINGISFADEISTLIDAPYVNYILAAKDEQKLKEIHNSIKNVDSWLEDNIDKVVAELNIDKAYRNYIAENISSLYYDLTENEISAFKELMKIAFYYGISDEIFDLKIV